MAQSGPGACDLGLNMHTVSSSYIRSWACSGALFKTSVFAAQIVGNGERNMRTDGIAFSGGFSWSREEERKDRDKDFGARSRADAAPWQATHTFRGVPR
jgi:hypothetical protein